MQVGLLVNEEFSEAKVDQVNLARLVVDQFQMLPDFGLLLYGVILFECFTELLVPHWQIDRAC